MPDEVASGHRRRRVRRLAVVLLTLVALGIWGAVAGFSALAAARDLELARDQFADAETLLRDAELSRAREELGRATASSSAAADRLTAWYVRPFELVPRLGPNLRAARVLSVTARDVGRDGGALLDAAVVIVNDDRNQGVGEISIDYLQELAPPMRSLVSTLEVSLGEVADLDPDALIGRITRARELFLDLVEPNLEQAIAAADLLDVLPTFLGEDEPRTYLVAAAALSESRGSSGLLGSWTIMTADEGQMDFQEFVDIDDLPAAPSAATAPSDEFEYRYADLQSLRNWRNVNFSPDFPAVASVLIELYESGGGGTVDGVVVADTVVFEYLAARSGGIDVPGVGRLEADEALQFVGLDAYDAFDSDEERKRILGATAAATFAELFQILEDDDVPATVEMLADLAAGEHLRIFSVDQAVQDALVRAGVGGELPPTSGESTGVFLNNFAENKLDFFARRAIEHRVRLADDGRTHAEVTVVLANEAPEQGHRRAVLGPWVDGLDAGDVRWLVTFSCGIGCELIEHPQDDHVGGVERGRPMTDHLLTLRSGEQAMLEYRTVTDGGWQREGEQAIVDIEHLVQPTLFGTGLSLVVEIPDGYRVAELPEGARVDDDEVVWAEVTSGRVSLRVVFEALR